MNIIEQMKIKRELRKNSHMLNKILELTSAKQWKTPLYYPFNTLTIQHYVNTLFSKRHSIKQKAKTFEDIKDMLSNRVRYLNGERIDLKIIDEYNIFSGQIKKRTDAASIFMDNVKYLLSFVELADNQYKKIAEAEKKAYRRNITKPEIKAVPIANLCYTTTHIDIRGRKVPQNYFVLLDFSVESIEQRNMIAGGKIKNYDHPVACVLSTMEYLTNITMQLDYFFSYNEFKLHFKLGDKDLLYFKRQGLESLTYSDENDKPQPIYTLCESWEPIAKALKNDLTTFAEIVAFEKESNKRQIDYAIQLNLEEQRKLEEAERAIEEKKRKELEELEAYYSEEL